MKRVSRRGGGVSALLCAALPLQKLTAWGALGGILRAPEARREFARAEGLRDLEAILTRVRELYS